MKRTIHRHTDAAYSLHDMVVTAFEIKNQDVFMRTQSGMVRTTPPFDQTDGYVEFHQVDWAFSYIYIFDFVGNAGKFLGEKMFLKDFIENTEQFYLTIMDETYGYHMTKYSGYLSLGQNLCECIVELSHEGDMIFAEGSV